MGIPGKNGLCPEWHGCCDQCVGVWGVVLPSCWAPWFGESESEVAQLCPILCDPMDRGACTRLLCPRDFLGKSTGVGCHFLLQGIFPTQGLNPGLPHCRQTLYCLSHQGSPKDESKEGYNSMSMVFWGNDFPYTAIAFVFKKIFYFGMEGTCTPMADSCQCMAKPLQFCKVISLQLK